MKKGKVTKITRMEKKDNYGNTSFIIELDNGDKGFYTSKNEDQKKFIIGQEAEYNIEEKQGKNSTYFKISLPQSEQQGGGQWPKGGRPAPDPKVQMISFAMAYSRDLVVAKIIPLADMNKYFDIIYDAMLKKIV